MLTANSNNSNFDAFLIFLIKINVIFSCKLKSRVLLISTTSQFKQYIEDVPIEKESALKQMQADYDFELLDGSIKINASKLIKMMLRWAQKDTRAMRKLMVIIIYLFRDAPEATSLLKIISYLSKENIYGVLKIMPKVVQMMVPSLPDTHKYI